MAADWYYVANGQQSGPVDLETLRQMLGSATVSQADLVFGPGLAEWTPAGQVPALSTGVGEVRVASAQESTYGAIAAASATTLGYRGVETGAAGLSDGAMIALRQTKPWVRFIAIMTFIGAGFILLAALAMLVGGLAMASNSRVGGLPAGLGVVYLAMAAIYIIPAVLLNRYASGIGRLMQSHRMSDLEQALGAQKSFWRFSGIMIIVVMAIYLIVIIFAIAFSVHF